MAQHTDSTTLATPSLHKHWGGLFLVKLTRRKRTEKYAEERLRRVGSMRRKSSAGMTLIEILVVMGLMAFITMAVVSGINNTTRGVIENASREMASFIRANFDEAALKGRITRLAIDIDKNQYWAELGPMDFVLMTSEQIEEEDRRDRRRTDEERKAIKKPTFSLNKELSRDKKSLPSSVKFTDVIVPQSKEPLKGGIVYAHVFPHGHMEPVTIHLKDNSDRESTLIVDAITGKSRIFGSYMREKSL
jgi:type II secretory pathway pseudopilin PulG